MTNEEILKKVKELKKGAWIKLIKSKSLPQGIIKYTSMIIRVGCETQNLKGYQGKQVGALPWGQWLKDYEGLVIVHTPKKTNVEKMYLRIENTYVHNSSSKFMRYGEEITKEQAMDLVGSAVNGSKASDVYNIDFANIEQIG